MIQRPARLDSSRSCELTPPASPAGALRGRAPASTPTPTSARRARRAPRRGSCPGGLARRVTRRVARCARRAPRRLTRRSRTLARCRRRCCPTSHPTCSRTHPTCSRPTCCPTCPRSARRPGRLTRRVARRATRRLTRRPRRTRRVLTGRPTRRVPRRTTRRLTRRPVARRVSPEVPPDVFPDVPPDVWPDVPDDPTCSHPTSHRTCSPTSPTCCPDVLPDVPPDVLPEVLPDVLPDVPPVLDGPVPWTSAQIAHTSSVHLPKGSPVRSRSNPLPSGERRRRAHERGRHARARAAADHLLGAGHFAVTDFVAALRRRADDVHVLDRAHVVVGVGGPGGERDAGADAGCCQRHHRHSDEPLVIADELHRSPPRPTTLPSLFRAMGSKVRMTSGAVSRSRYAFSDSVARRSSPSVSSALACATESKRFERLGRYPEPFGQLGAAQTLRLEVEGQLVRGREAAPISRRRHLAPTYGRRRFASRVVATRFADSPSAVPRSARLRTPSLVIARKRCPSTVLTPTPSRSAMALFDSPPAASRLTSSSRRVRAGTTSRLASAGVRAPPHAASNRRRRAGRTFRAHSETAASVRRDRLGRGLCREQPASGPLERLRHRLERRAVVGGAALVRARGKVCGPAARRSCTMSSSPSNTSRGCAPIRSASCSTSPCVNRLPFDSSPRRPRRAGCRTGVVSSPAATAAQARPIATS